MCTQLLCYFYTTEYKRPKLRDIYRYVVPKYAHNWEYLGTLLYFDQAELMTISKNFRNDSEECCRNLMSRWLDKNHDASWDQLLSATDDLSSHPDFAYQSMNHKQYLSILVGHLILALAMYAQMKHITI